MPIVEEDAYVEDYDSCTYQESIRLSDKYAFFEEAKDIIKYLTEMKNHKIIPSARFHEGQLELDMASFTKAESAIDELDKHYRDSLKTPTSVLQQIEQCDNVGGAGTKCPSWTQWEEWASCKLVCEQKGTVRYRKCYLNV